MGFQVSPGVEVKEIDLTNVIPAVSTSIGGYSGYFRSGPVNEVTTISSEKELASKFGTPDTAHTQSFLTAASFLKYGNALKVVRAGDSNMRNAVAGTHEVPSGGIEGVAIASTPTQFVDVNGDETLSIVESTTSGGNGATIAPRYDVNTPTRVTGYKLSAGDAIDVSAANIQTDTDYNVTIQGKTVKITVSSSGSSAEVASDQADVFFPSNAQSAVSGFTDSAASPATVTGAFVASGTFTEVVITNSTTGVADGDTITVFTTNGDTTSPSFTITVGTDTSGSPDVPTFALAAGVADVSAFDALSAANKSGLEAFDEDGNIIPGLFFNATYNIAAIASTADGSGYVVANVTVGFNDPAASPAGVVSLESGNFTFDEQETEFSTAELIENESAFEAKYPPASTSVLPGLMFARSAGTMGNSLAAYVLDSATFASAPTSIQNQFDAAPTGTEVHVFVFDEDGEITGIAGSELEKYSFLDTTAGAKLDDGSNNNVKDVINEKSAYIYMARDTAASATAYSFTGGVDVATPGTAVSGDIITGLAELEDSELVDVNLLFAQVDATSGLTIGAELQRIAFARKDAVAFVSAPISTTTGNTTAAADVVTEATSGIARGVEGSYAFLDSTALYVYNKYADNYVYIPASGHMAGLCAKTDGLAEPWFSPAGFNRGALLGVTKLGYNPKKADRDTLYKGGVNPIVSFPGEGIVLFGDKTAQAKPSAFDRINVRRLFAVLEKAIATAAKFQLFELNDEFTRAMFRNMTEPFLRDVKGRRGITDFLVVCDETNNTGEIIDSNRFVAAIFIKPARSINFITLNFIATRTGVEFSEIVGK